MRAASDGSRPVDRRTLLVGAAGAFAAKPKWGADSASAARALPAGRPTAPLHCMFASARILGWRALVSMSCSRAHRSDM
jgi:hypothetical protein